MRLLLDTHALLWWWMEDFDRLPRSAKRLIEDASNTILVSPVSAWELATKERLGKLEEAGPAVANFTDWVERDEFRALPLHVGHGLMAGAFTAVHGDPFDRMLAAQSIIEDAPILSRDTQLDAFGCERIWA